MYVFFIVCRKFVSWFELVLNCLYTEGEFAICLWIRVKKRGFWSDHVSSFRRQR